MREPLGASVEGIPLRASDAVGDLLALVEQPDGGPPVGLVIGGIEGQGGLVVGQGRPEVVHLHGRRAQCDMVAHVLRIEARGGHQQEAGEAGRDQAQSHFP
jgi:hypothetical protein